MNGGLFFVGLLCFAIGLITMLSGSRSRGGFGHGDTSIEGPVWFILIALGIVLMAVANGLP